MRRPLPGAWRVRASGLELRPWSAAAGFKSGRHGQHGGASARRRDRSQRAPSDTMAPSRKKRAQGTGTNSAEKKRLAAFLKDFDREVQIRIDQLQTNGENLVKELDNLYDIEIFKLPVALREMNWLDYFAKGGSKKALEEAAMVHLAQACSSTKTQR
ncbi:borealin-like isoform X2 [Emydura macquarii macquarii]|uniref:borealin-like isoform X2 n=1 Tax=Emydura macquarii macquarii TaxID=1129001 RepID=UPI003529E3F9